MQISDNEAFKIAVIPGYAEIIKGDILEAKEGAYLEDIARIDTVILCRNKVYWIAIAISTATYKYFIKSNSDISTAVLTPTLLIGWALVFWTQKLHKVTLIFQEYYRRPIAIEHPLPI